MTPGTFNQAILIQGSYDNFMEIQSIIRVALRNTLARWHFH